MHYRILLVLQGFLKIRRPLHSFGCQIGSKSTIGRFNLDKTGYPVGWDRDEGYDNVRTRGFGLLMGHQWKKCHIIRLWTLKWRSRYWKVISESFWRISIQLLNYNFSKFHVTPKANEIPEVSTIDQFDSGVPKWVLMRLRDDTQSHSWARPNFRAIQALITKSKRCTLYFYIQIYLDPSSSQERISSWYKISRGDILRSFATTTTTPLFASVWQKQSSSSFISQYG